MGALATAGMYGDLNKFNARHLGPRCACKQRRPSRLVDLSCILPASYSRSVIRSSLAPIQYWTAKYERRPGRQTSRGAEQHRQRGVCLCGCSLADCFCFTAVRLVLYDRSILQGEEGPPAKRHRAEQRVRPLVRCSVGGAFQVVPPELLPRILGFLSAHDLSTATSLTCQGLRFASADNILWRRLYKARYLAVCFTEYRQEVINIACVCIQSKLLLGFSEGAGSHMW